ncbi:hypothetical protein PENSPDRAFT_760505, partial [Peniophora sp. CONT]
MANIIVQQDAVCRSFNWSRTKPAARNAIAKISGVCIGCLQSKPECRFYKEAAKRRITEQRTFLVSPAPEYRVLQVMLQEHSDYVAPSFESAPPAMTRDIVQECLTASAFILVPKLQRHLALRTLYTSKVIRVPRLDHLRDICDYCRMSLFCCTRVCKSCGYEICDQCMQEHKLETTSCSAPQLAGGHDMALVEPFQPGELEEALMSLQDTPRPERPAWISDGKLIEVQLTNGGGLPRYSDLYRALAAGVPVVVHGINAGDYNLTPEYFIRRFGSQKVTVINIKTTDRYDLDLEAFMNKMCLREDPDDPVKLKDWPPTDHFATRFPDLFKVFEDCLVAPWLTARKGILNLEASMPAGSCPPDTGPKGYLAQSATGSITTFLHTDMTDAINIMFYAGVQADGSEGGAEWTMVAREDKARTEELLREMKKWNDCDGHPVHAQQLEITPNDVVFLRQHGIRVWTFVQRVGDAVFIAAGVLHQVRNLSACIKIAVDFVAPCNVEHSQKIGEELREHRVITQDSAEEDVLQLTTMCWWFYKRSKTYDLAGLHHDQRSNPWVCDFSAAPAYMPFPVLAHAPDPDHDGADTDGMHLSGEPWADTAPLSASSSLPTPVIPVSLQSDYPSSIVPRKRSRAHDEEFVSKTQSRRSFGNKRKALDSQEDPKKAFQCPIGRSGGRAACTKAGTAYNRQALLDHLEKVHKPR